MNEPAPFDPFAALAAAGIAPPEPVDVTKINPGEDEQGDGWREISLVDLLEMLGAHDKPIPDPDAENGINPKDALGMKKPDLSVVPPAGSLHLASAMMDGAAKYGAFNWRENKVLARVYVAAAMRHLTQYLDGEDIDPISKVHHLGHAMACCAILLDARETGNLVDNRPVVGASGDMIRRWTEENKFG